MFFNFPHRATHEQEKVPCAAEVQQRGAGLPERHPQHDDLRREALPRRLRRATRPQVRCFRLTGF